jgi:glutathione S-transferase
MWVKTGGHPCWRVQKALDDAGVEYEVVKYKPFGRGREGLEKLTGQRKLPAVELEDGTVIREESKDLKKRIEEGRLQEPAASA